MLHLWCDKIQKLQYHFFNVYNILQKKPGGKPHHQYIVNSSKPCHTNQDPKMHIKLVCA